MLKNSISPVAREKARRARERDAKDIASDIIRKALEVGIAPLKLMKLVKSLLRGHGAQSGSSAREESPATDVEDGVEIEQLEAVFKAIAVRARALLAQDGVNDVETPRKQAARGRILGKRKRGAEDPDSEPYPTARDRKRARADYAASSEEGGTQEKAVRGVKLPETPESLKVQDGLRNEEDGAWPADIGEDSGANVEQAKVVVELLVIRAQALLPQDGNVGQTTKTGPG
ncbi:hypothetical protein VTJ49DRAFT_3582 [Mycothermus thermophilus]|uniref:Uncharacterized protein n=1 Tax=Humicola insolens TaxID=85995 RepID=A0ABR3VPQ9_HUMIN